jgi:hypothetical protein
MGFLRRMLNAPAPEGARKFGWGTAVRRKLAPLDDIGQPGGTTLNTASFVFTKVHLFIKISNLVAPTRLLSFSSARNFSVDDCLQPFADWTRNQFSAGTVGTRLAC